MENVLCEQQIKSWLHDVLLEFIAFFFKKMVRGIGSSKKNLEERKVETSKTSPKKKKKVKNFSHALFVFFSALDILKRSTQQKQQKCWFTNKNNVWVLYNLTTYFWPLLAQWNNETARKTTNTGRLEMFVTQIRALECLVAKHSENCSFNQQRKNKVGSNKNLEHESICISTQKLYSDGHITICTDFSNVVGARS